MSSIDRALDALELVAGGHELKLTDVAKELGVSRATAFRLLVNLERRDYVEHDAQRHVYYVGRRLSALASDAEDRTVVVLAKPGMNQLRQFVGETVNLAVLRHNELVYATVLDVERSLRLAARVGSVAPLHATALGKAVLATLSDERAMELAGDEPYKKFTSNTLTFAVDLLSELACIRERGFAVDREEAEVGATCIAAALKRSDGQAVGAISVSGPTARMTSLSNEDVGKRVQALCAEVSKALARR
ncbi:MAG: IclR family transcriptional regulator [Candidatus Dormibacteraeota bacterium]|nr:IclR family transcriptional regulator [Candidatus Dormibacteraeota bacterium]